MRINVVILLQCALAAQSSVPSPEANFGFSEQGPRYGGQFTLNAPFSAKRVKEHSQILSNGTRVTQPTSTILMFRDGAGRTRAEWPIAIGPIARSGTLIVQIEDPGIGVEYVLDQQHRVTHRLPIARKTPMYDQGPPAVSSTASRSNEAPGRPQFTIEDLGAQTIEGLHAKGYRETRIDPAGFSGNDGPVTTIREVWWSVELRMNIVIKTSSPVTGEETIRFVDITLGEPAPSLFQPPSDYNLIEESGPFVLRLKL